MSRARKYGSILIGLSAALPLRARADAGVETVRLEYIGIAGCPSEAEFSDEVRARTRKAAFSPRASGRRFRVRIERSGADFAGTLDLVEADGATSERRIDGEVCTDVVSALALVAALAIDPDASTAPRKDLRVPPPLPEPAAPRAVPTPNASEPAARLGLGVGLSVGAVRGPAPELLFAAGPSVLAFRDAHGWQPSLRLTLLAAETGIVSASSELATFRWAAARTELCPHRLGVSERVTLQACALIDLGVLYARGDQAEQPGSASRPWLSVGIGLGLDVAITQRLSMGFAVGESANVTRDDFVFLEVPKRHVHTVPLTTQSAVLGLTWRLL